MPASPGHRRDMTSNVESDAMPKQTHFFLFVSAGQIPDFIRNQRHQAAGEQLPAGHGAWLTDALRILRRRAASRGQPHHHGNCCIHVTLKILNELLTSYTWRTSYS